MTATKHDSTLLDATRPHGWLSVANAAHLLDVRPDTLRRRIERAARMAPDGVIEAAVDGLRARKLGRSWRVFLGAGWQIAPAAAASPRAGAFPTVVAGGGNDGRS